MCGFERFIMDYRVFVVRIKIKQSMLNIGNNCEYDKYAK